MTALPDWLAEQKATARAALDARREREAADRARDLARNRENLLAVLVLDLSPDLIALAGGLGKVARISKDFNGLTTSYLFDLVIPGYHPIQVYYVRAGPAWVRGVWDYPSDDPVDEGAPLWRIYRPGGWAFARGIGALALAEMEQEQEPPF